MSSITTTFSLFIMLSSAFGLGNELEHDGISYKEMESYFQRFIQSFPVLKFSGFFNRMDSTKIGLHVSNCSLTTCEVYYNDYASFKGPYIPLPECKSPKPLQIIDDNHATIGDAKLSIRGSTLSIKGRILFECNPIIITKNISQLQANLDRDDDNNYNNLLGSRLAYKEFDINSIFRISNRLYWIPDSSVNTLDFDALDSNMESSASRDPFLVYQISIKDSIFEANTSYPVNLDCIHRKDFSSSLICAQPYLSNAYSFGQFFIYLAAQKPKSFRISQNIYQDYKAMQNKIAQCKYQSRSSYCILLAIEEFEKQTTQNLIFRKE